MQSDSRPYWLKSLYLYLRYRYAEYFLRPRCSRLGAHHTIMRPRHVRISGPNISIGKCFTAIGDPCHPVEIAVWGAGPGRGRVLIGDAVLLGPGSRISAAEEIRIGDGTMLARGAYVTDSDWHGLYDRVSRPPAAPVSLGRNVWLGDHATVLKGVTVGDNSVIAAGAVVTRDVPADCVVAGNPARIVRELEPGRERYTRCDMYADPPALERLVDALDREALRGNTFWRWLGGLVYPPMRRS